MTLDLAKLRAETLALIDGTTPGPWKWWTSNSWRRLKADHSGYSPSVLEPFAASDGHPDCAVSKNDMAMIAAAPTLAADNLRLVDDNLRLVDEIERLRELIREGCDLLAIESEALREGLSIGDVFSPGPEDQPAVDAINEMEGWIDRAGRAALAEGGPDDR